MKKAYKELLNKIDIYNINHGHSIAITIKNFPGDEVYSTFGKTDRRAALINDIAASLELCAELAKFNVLNLKQLADVVQKSINKFNSENIGITERANIIKDYCVNIAEDMNRYLLLNAYSLFDLYNNYEIKEIKAGYNFICEKIFLIQ